MKFKFDFSNNIVNLSNTILKTYGVKTFHPTIPELEKILKGHKKIAVLLFDGSGSYILNKHLKKNCFLRDHYFLSISSTFPPTTVAATNGLLSGKYPIETGWLAWGVYMKEYSANVSCFMNERVRDRKEVRPKSQNIMEEICHYDHLTDLISLTHPRIKVEEIYRYPCKLNHPSPKTLKESKDMINHFLEGNKNAFLYFYWDEPDGEMHENGVDSFEARYQLENINKFVRDVVRENLDTTFIVLSDHGHINVEWLDLLEHKDLCALLEHECSLEVRTIGFYVKKGKESQFEGLFNKYYGNYFLLFTRESAIKQKLFGEGKIHKRSREFMGDFIAIATDKYALYFNEVVNGHVPHIMKGHHGGFTKEEMLIDVSIFNA